MTSTQTTDQGTTTMTSYKRRNVKLGTVPGQPYGYKRDLDVTVDVEVRVEAGEHETTDHRKVVEVRRFSIMGCVWKPGHSDCVSAGQIHDVLSQLSTYARGFDADKAAQLTAMWKRWHLNDMSAACAHQEVVWEDTGHGRRPSLDKTPPCPVTGYRYGHAWLAEDLPANFIAELISVLPAKDGRAN